MMPEKGRARVEPDRAAGRPKRVRTVPTERKFFPPEPYIRHPPSVPPITDPEKVPPDWNCEDDDIDDK